MVEDALGTSPRHVPAIDGLRAITVSPFDGTSPIFFDMHHITMHANKMPRSDFRRGMAILSESR